MIKWKFHWLKQTTAKNDNPPSQLKITSQRLYKLISQQAQALMCDDYDLLYIQYYRLIGCATPVSIFTAVRPLSHFRNTVLPLFLFPNTHLNQNFAATETLDPLAYSFSCVST